MHAAIDDREAERFVRARPRFCRRHQRAADPAALRVRHAELVIGDSVLFVNDTFPEMGGGASVMTLWIYTANVDAAFD